MENVHDSKKRKVPMRMCIGCRSMHEKKSLVRIIAGEDGNAIIDKSGRSNGRGAYLCRNAECIDRAVKTRAIERTLGVKRITECIELLRGDLS